MKKLLVFLMVAASVLFGCGGATQVRNSQSKCNSSGSTGSCTLSIGSIEGGVYNYKVYNSYFRNANRTAEVSARISIGAGEVLVWLEDSGGNKTTAAVLPGQLAELRGLAQITGPTDDLAFRVYFEPQGQAEKNRTENIQAEIQYRIP